MCLRNGITHHVYVQGFIYRRVTLGTAQYSIYMVKPSIVISSMYNSNHKRVYCCNIVESKETRLNLLLIV